MKNFLQKKLKGFTLIEMMVATSIFTIVALGGLAVLLASQRAYDRVSSNRVVIDNTNLVLDSISRELKFGNKYGCVNLSNGQYASWSQDPFNYLSFSSNLLFNDTSGFCNAIAFTPENSETKKIVYYIDNSSKTINQAEYTFNNISQQYDLVTDYIITSDDYVIKNFWIEVVGVSNTDFKQPSVFLFMSGIVNLVKNSQGVVTATSTFALQSVVSQRTLDN